jgi:hypothetical protein
MALTVSKCIIPVKYEQPGDLQGAMSVMSVPRRSQPFKFLGLLGTAGFGVSSILSLTHVGPTVRFIFALVTIVIISTVQKLAVLDIKFYLFSRKLPYLAIIVETLFG